MCHSLKWEEWELLEEERRTDDEPRVIEVAHEREAEEPELEREPEHDPERELVRA